MNNEQLSFLEPVEKQKCEPYIKYDATICSRCCCNRCKYSVEIYPALSTEECKEVQDNSCFNCDECYYYGMDNKNLSRAVIKFQCDKFERTKYHEEREAKSRRRRFKII